jgi:PAS domain S-box-containing protein
MSGSADGFADGVAFGAHRDIAAVALAQRWGSARVITFSLAVLTFVAAAITLIIGTHFWMAPFLSAVAIGMSVAYWLARRGALDVAVSVMAACVFIEHVGSVAISGMLGPMPFIAPVVILLVAATSTSRGLWLALGACFVTLGAEGMLTPWSTTDRAVIATGGLFTALVFVVSLLHARSVERAFAMAADHAKAREEAARRALELERRYRLITESADDLIALVRSTGEVVYLSPSHERVLGLPVEVLTQGSFIEHLEIENLEEVATLFRRASADGRGRFELRIRRVDGQLRIFDVRTRRIDSETGDLMALISRDVTEQRALETRLQAAERMEALGRLAGSVAHDFNNLLTVIQCSAEIGMARLADDHSTRDDLNAVLRASSTAADLAQQLLTFSRRQLLVRVPTDVGAVISSQRDLLERLVGGKVNIECSFAPELPLVVIPKAHVEQLTMNLAANARDAMPNGGALRIATRLVGLRDREIEDLVAGEYVELEVHDDGEGIAVDVIGRVFEPLFSTKAGLGTGLGLATCHAIATQAGGAIVVRSELGKGATFRVFLPTAFDSSPPLPPSVLGRVPKHVLVVDDDANVRELVRRMLRSDGFEVKVAASVAEGHAYIEQADVALDALITDIVVGHERGTDLLGPCRAAQPEASILLMSGYVPEPGAADALVKHGATFLGKPFGRDQLLAALRSQGAPQRVERAAMTVVGEPARAPRDVGAEPR